MDYAIRFAEQLKQHLRSLRKARGLSQARLAQALGVGQSRVAEIEANPGTVSVDTLFKVLTALDVQLVLRDAREALAPTPEGGSQPPEKKTITRSGSKRGAPKVPW